MSDRARAWRSVAVHALRRDIRPDRIVSIYPNEADIAQRLAELIAAEEDCCPFLEFDLEPDGPQLRVEMRYPPEFASTLTAVLGAEPA